MVILLLTQVLLHMTDWLQMILVNLEHTSVMILELQIFCHTFRRLQFTQKKEKKVLSCNIILTSWIKGEETCSICSTEVTEKINWKKKQQTFLLTHSYLVDTGDMSLKVSFIFFISTLIVNYKFWNPFIKNYLSWKGCTTDH